ncbi:hypothetical protein LOC70_13155 [Rhodopirellula sp. JC737]|nr:hypothetical protein [Rhodopirellula sp. JC737]MCC9656753.1 hypothetical protein [Rhodopirellula sp. JC737]
MESRLSDHGESVILHIENVTSGIKPATFLIFKEEDNSLPVYKATVPELAFDLLSTAVLSPRTGSSEFGPKLLQY